MSRRVAALALMVCGAVALRVAQGDHVAYVKDSLTWPLRLAAVVLLLVAWAEWWRGWMPSRAGAPAGGRGRHRARRPGSSPDGGDAGARGEVQERGDGPEHEPGLGHGLGQAHGHGTTGHGHGHGHRHLAPAIGWVLTVPFVLLAAVPPTPVGAWSADRVGGNADAAVATAWTPEFAPLDPHAGVHVMSLRQFWERAAFDPKRSLSGLTVRLTGFVGSGGAAPDAGGEGWSLTRMAILCCAADAFPLTVRMLGAASPAAGQWVEVEGVWAPDPAAPAPDSPEAGRQTPRLRVLKLTPIAVPARPYDEPPP